MRKLTAAFAGLLLVLIMLLSAGRAEAEEAIRLPVVMYHHISEDSKSWNNYVISAAEFEGDLRWLDEHGYETVRLSELLAWSRGEFTLPEKPCMITLDDGFQSTMVYAEPLLDRYGFSGVCALIGTECEKEAEESTRDVRWSDLSWEEARAMGERGTLELICHTWDLHSMSGRMGCQKIKWESSADYRAFLTRDLSRFFSVCRKHSVPVQSAIAYPYGAYSEETTAAVRDFGLEAAFTCTERINHLTGAEGELYTLCRFNRPHGISREKFFGKWDENS